MKRFLLFLLLVSFCGFSQPGSLDLSFNTDGSNFGSGPSSYVNDMELLPSGKVLVAGYFPLYNGLSYPRLVRINQNGSVDESFTVGSGVNGTVFCLAVQTDGKILIGGDMYSYNGILKAYIARLNADGTLDSSFNTGTGFNSQVQAITVQPDGKIIVTGAFTSYNGVTCNRIVRLNADSSLDTSFSVGSGLNGTGYCAEVLPDGKILIAGQFGTYNGTLSPGVARLQSNGTLDPTFTTFSTISGGIRTLAIQADGKLVVGGTFSNLGGSGRNYFARLLANGGIDATFNSGTGAQFFVQTAKIQTDGKILIGGQFTNYNGVARNRIARLFSDGSLDTTFNPGTGADYHVYSTVTLPDSSILLGGFFNNFDGKPKDYLAKISATGQFDLSFNPPQGASDAVLRTMVLADQKVVIGGQFYYYEGEVKNRFTRLTANGDPDTTFNTGTGPGYTIYAMEQLPNGKVIAGGYFGSFNGIARNGAAQLFPDGSVDPGFSPALPSDIVVMKLLRQSDGKILVGGYRILSSGVLQGYVTRLNADGSTDGTFGLGTGFNGVVRDLALAADGKIIVVGDFSSYNGYSGTLRVARLNSNGSVDSSFNIGSSANSMAYCVVIQSDGKIVIGGYFTTFAGVTKNYIVRLNTNGSLDNTFQTGTGANSAVFSLALQSDGKIVVAGQFYSFNSVAKGSIARLNADGSMDNSFTGGGTGANGAIHSVSLQADGKIIIGGFFTAYNGKPVQRIARLIGTAACPSVTQTTQQFCDSSSPTIASLAATDQGGGINWYSSATATTPMSTTTGLTNGSTYYADNSFGTCGSRTAVTVVITGAPTGNYMQGGCSNTQNPLRISDLVANGNNVKWYDVAQGGSPLAPSTVLVHNTFYYASQTNAVTGCESSRLSVLAVVYMTPVATQPSNLTACSANSTASFDLSQQTATILGSQSSSDFSVSYHTTLDGLNTNTDIIANPSAYSASNGTTIWAKVSNNGYTACFSGTSFQLFITTGQTYYADADQDGFGNPASGIYSCSQMPQGYVTNNSDCDDNSILYLDNDGDGYGISTIAACGAPNNTDCNDASSSVWQSGIFYVDADADGYTSGETQILCFGNATPSGYLTTATAIDCNDEIAAIHPNATEIPYNGIDDNCDNTIDEGSQMFSQVLASQCGTTLTAINSLIGAVSFGLPVDGYRFRVVNTSTNAVQTIDRTAPNFSLTQLASYEYATTYSISVMLRRNGVWLNYYGTTCLVSTPAVLDNGGASSVSPSQCGSTLPTIATLIATTSLQGVTGYRFRITNMSDNTAPNQVQILDRATHWFSLPMLSTYTYGTTYTVEVALKTTGNYSGYGAACSVTTPAVPVVTNCGTATSPSMYFYTTSMNRATSYRFELTDLSTFVTTIVDRPSHYFNFSQVPGYVPGAQYGVRVAVMTTGAWSLFGESCVITAPGAALRGEISGAETPEISFRAIGYPNPYIEGFSIDIDTPSDQKIQIKVYDMMGKLLEERELAPAEIETQQFGSRYPSGIYNVIVLQGEYAKTLRMIKR